MEQRNTAWTIIAWFLRKILQVFKSYIQIAVNMKKASHVNRVQVIRTFSVKQDLTVQYPSSVE